MLPTVAGFDWDVGNRRKCQKHGVSIPEIEAVFRSALRVAPDLKHSQLEERYIAIGRLAGGRAVFVAFAYRFADRKTLIRPISARFMHKKEFDAYEEKSSQV